MQIDVMKKDGEIMANNNMLKNMVKTMIYRTQNCTKSVERGRKKVNL